MYKPLMFATAANNKALHNLHYKINAVDYREIDVGLRTSWCRSSMLNRYMDSLNTMATGNCN